MTSTPYISLEQWRALIAVVDAGGYAQAAELLHKSQSTVTYAVQKIESLLGVKAFEIQGRKAILTPTGELLYRRARALLDEASGLERSAKALSAGWEAEIRIAVEVLFPTWLLLACLDQFGAQCPHTHIEVIESVINGTPEALMQGEADLAISARIPPGFMGDHLMRMRMIPTAHPDHPLHSLGRKVTMQDLRAHRHLVVRDSGSKRTKDAAVNAVQRWTVSSLATSIQAARLGYGYAWFPEEKIRDELSAGILKALPVRDGQERYVDLYLILADPDYAGPGARQFMQLVRDAAAKACSKEKCGSPDAK